MPEWESKIVAQPKAIEAAIKSIFLEVSDPPDWNKISKIC